MPSLERQALASGRVARPITIDTNRDATVAAITLPIEGNGIDAASKRSLAVLRDLVPQTLGVLPCDPFERKTLRIPAELRYPVEHQQDRRPFWVRPGIADDLPSDTRLNTKFLFKFTCESSALPASESTSTAKL